MSARILLIRHARIDTGGRLCGSFDVPLSERGRAEVEELTSREPRYPSPGVLYASSLTRARQVAVALGRAWGLEPMCADWAREIDCGEVEGVRLERLKRERPALWARHRAQDDDGFTWPGGESYRDFRSRVLQGLAAVAESHAGERIAIVTHAGVIAQVLGVVRGRRPAVWSEDRPDPLTATELSWVNGRPAGILSHNERDWF